MTHVCRESREIRQKPSQASCLIQGLIRTYQRITNIIFPKNCRFHPSCSQYALEAVQKYGPLKGLGKAGLRIVRCSPLSRGGYDPVR